MDLKIKIRRLREIFILRIGRLDSDVDREEHASLHLVHREHMGVSQQGLERNRSGLRRELVLGSRL